MSSELVNGSFEFVGGDGVPLAWRKFGGQMTTTTSRKTDGQRSLEYRSSTTSTKWVFQTVLVAGGDYYRGLVDAQPGEGVEAVFLRISWYASNDGSGPALGSTDSGPAPAGQAFTRLDTGAIQAPPEARTAGVRLMLRPSSEAPAVAYFDAVEFDVALAPTATASPSPSPVTSPTATATAPTASAAPGTATPTPTAALVEAPQFFASLTNAGFEEVDGGGAPYGWRKVGGEISAVAEPRVEGNRALRLASSTTSTKWAYQTVSVEPGAYYEASVQSLKNDSAAEALFLRLSWYAAEDGEGSAIDSVDSTEFLNADSPAFWALSTGAVQAPSEARSVRIKLMLRPASAAAATAYFDDVRLGRVSPPAGSAALPSAGTAAGPARAAGSTPVPATRTPGVLAAVSTPVVPANVGTRATPVPATVLTQGAGSDWLTYTALSVAVVALGLAAFSEFRRRAERPGA